MSEAGKYDETVKSKKISQSVEGGVGILSAQTDVQHCVSTLVVNCTKSGWAMWRFFPDHSGTQVGHESKIAKVGFCEGWAPLCDWLRESQVDQEVDWPSACTTLKALNKVSLADVRGLFLVMHANNPAVATLVCLVQGTGYIDRQFAVQCYLAQRSPSRFRADGAGVIVVVGPWGLFPLCGWHGFLTAMCRLDSTRAEEW